MPALRRSLLPAAPPPESPLRLQGRRRLGGGRSPGSVLRVVRGMWWVWWGRALETRPGVDAGGVTSWVFFFPMVI